MPHPSKFYYTIPICMSCYKMYTLLDTHRESILFKKMETKTESGNKKVIEVKTRQQEIEKTANLIDKKHFIDSNIGKLDKESPGKKSKSKLRRKTKFKLKEHVEVNDDDNILTNTMDELIREDELLKHKNDDTDDDLDESEAADHFDIHAFPKQKSFNQITPKKENLTSNVAQEEINNQSDDSENNLIGRRNILKEKLLSRLDQTLNVTSHIPRKMRNSMISQPSLRRKSKLKILNKIYIDDKVPKLNKTIEPQNNENMTTFQKSKRLPMKSSNNEDLVDNSNINDQRVNENMINEHLKSPEKTKSAKKMIISPKTVDNYNNIDNENINDNDKNKNYNINNTISKSIKFEQPNEDLMMKSSQNYSNKEETHKSHSELLFGYKDRTNAPGKISSWVRILSLSTSTKSLVKLKSANNKANKEPESHNVRPSSAFIALSKKKKTTR